MTKTQTTRHNHKIKFLRYILRRKQCAMLALIEVALFVMLLAFCIGAYFGYQIFNDQRIEIDKENAVIDRYGDNITFAHCKFIEVDKFNTQFCQNRIGVVAFAYRYHALEKENDVTCLDINEQMYCHDYLIKNKIGNPLPHVEDYLFGCPGYGNSSLNDGTITFDNTTTTINQPRMVPVDIDDGKIGNGTIMHVQELFIKCPKCASDGTSFVAGGGGGSSGGKTCVRKIKTIEKGWPWFAENCKEGEMVDCSSLPTTQTPENALTTVEPPDDRPQSSMMNLLHEQQQMDMSKNIKHDF